jgi:type II secretory pathway component PulC
MAVPSLSVSPRQLSAGLYVLAAVLIAGMAVFGARALGRPAEPAPQFASLDLRPAAQRAPAAPAVPLQVYQALAASPVFGTPSARPAAAAAAPTQAPPISAVVVGVLMSGGRSRAVVETGPGGQKLVSVGDSLAGGRVVEIGLTEVVVERDGGRITLPVRRSGHAPPPAAASSAPAAAVSAPSVALGAAAPAEAPDAQTDIDSGDIQLEDFGVFYDAVKKALLAATAKTAHDVADKPVGVAFSDLLEGTLLYRTGLRTGDIVTAVNDIPVTDMNSLLNAFDKVAADVRSQAESFIVIDVVRDQKPDAVILTIWQ